MTMLATSGKFVATEPASRLCCSNSCFLSIICACLLLFIFHSFLSKKNAPCFRRGHSSEQLEFNYIDRFGPFRTFFSIKADIVAFGKALKAAAPNRRMMDEYVTIIFSSNEAKTFAIVEPLHS